MDGLSERAVEIRLAAAKLEAIPTPDFGPLEDVINELREGLDRLAEMIEQVKQRESESESS